jgi:P-type Ca2+ transporter type 2C
VIILHAGDKVPADCIIINSTNLIVEEPKQHEKLKKDEKKDPFLYADSFILHGNVRAIVAVVGRASSRVNELNLELDKGTPLQKKLFVLSQTFTFIGLWAALIIFIVSTVILSIQTGVDDNVGGVIFSKKLVDNIILSFIIILVAIPEGLPMTVGISLAYSIHNMFLKDKILVRKLESNETMGEVTEFVLGKTGTLTTEDMSVVKFYVQDFIGSNTRKDTLTHCNISGHVLELLKESIIFNNQCHIEMNENAFYVPIGNGTEVSLLKWLQNAEIPVHTMIKVKETPSLKAHHEFSADEKMSIVAVETENEYGTKIVRVYVKGAPELIIDGCHHKFHSNGEKVEMTEHDKNYMVNDLMPKVFCKQLGLRCLAFSFADYSLEDFEQIQKETGNFANDRDFNRLLRGAHFCFIAMVAMKDPLRSGVKKAIELVKDEGKVNVRLVSADHLETALAYAADAGIVNKQILDENFGFEREN